MNLIEFNCRLRYASGFVVEAEFTTDARITALVGPSGSGKTSILSMIAGLRRPDVGRITLAGRRLDDTAARVHVAPEARRMGYVFQGHLLFPHLSVRQNLLYGWKRRAATARPAEFDHVVAVLELEPLLERLPHTLSGGERQRVALGRALMCGPELLLLDEPLSSIDDPLKRGCSITSSACCASGKSRPSTSRTTWAKCGGWRNTWCRSNQAACADPRPQPVQVRRFSEIFPPFWPAWENNSSCPSI